MKHSIGIAATLIALLESRSYLQAVTDSVKGNTHTLGSWSLTVVPVPAGGASSAAILAAAAFEQQSSFEPAAALSAPRPVSGANGHDDRNGDAVDGLFGSDAPAVDVADLLVDDRLLPATATKHGKRSAVDLVIEDIKANPFDEQLAEDLALVCQTVWPLAPGTIRPCSAARARVRLPNVALLENIQPLIQILVCSRTLVNR